MKIYKQLTALAVALSIASTAFAGVASDKAVYLGGTAAIKKDSEGTLDLSGSDIAVYRLKKSETLQIPYSAITSVEYGQKAGRRVGAAIATTILVSPVGLVMLASKKRKHIVTIGWTANGKNEAAVFEFGK